MTNDNDRHALASLLFCFSLSIVHAVLTWGRALAWWHEIGCSARSLPALYVQAWGRKDWVIDEIAIVIALASAAIWALVRRPELGTERRTR